MSRLEAVRNDRVQFVTRRPPDRGRGADGVVAHADGYWNPATEVLEGATA